MFADILILAFLIFINGFFSCAELAILSVNHNRVKFRAENGDKKALLIKKMMDNENNFLSTIQIAISLVSLFSGAFAGQTFAGPVVSLLLNLGVPVPEAALRNAVVLIITIFLSYFTLVFGELVPKRLALQRTEKMAGMLVGTVNLVSKICSPFVVLLSASAGFVVKLLGIDSKSQEDQYTEEDIRMMVDAGSEIGSIDENEMEMINNIFEFDDKTAEDICTHRTDIVAIDIEEPFSEILPVLMEMKYSRLPVYEESVDNIIGILFIKDVFRHFYANNNMGENELGSIDIRGIMREAYFVPTSKKSDELFAEMKHNKIHMSIVVDEYGGTVGLVTMEDLIEEIMGNIFDEYDDDELPKIITLDSNTFEINGTASLTDVAKVLDVNLPDDDYDTLSGFIISLLGRIPAEGERPEVEFEDILFKVKKADDKRIAVITACRM
ncbi:MAG: hemolysin family protein [Clostridiales bacterium]|nr:hemolysin family protein [Clostridiales bacterium]